jgi:prolyl oligopeptidase PreP (S9A serine peptidase family)
VPYQSLATQGEVLIQAKTGKISLRQDKPITELKGLTVQLKKYKNSWIYLYRLGPQKTSPCPTLIYTYGGFGVEPGVALKDYYSFLKQGGVVAEICPRGGLHEVFRYRWNTSRGHKEKTIQDVIAATKYLIAKKIAQPEQIGLTGASNGGFVVGAVINQAPHLYQAVLTEVGVMDLVNYSKYTGGDVWSCEYGTNKSKLKKLSPLNNISNKPYPAIYVVSGQYDTRVAPVHQIKYAQALKKQGHQVYFQSFPEGHGISSKKLSHNTVKFFTHFLLKDKRD